MSGLSSGLRPDNPVIYYWNAQFWLQLLHMTSDEDDLNIKSSVSMIRRLFMSKAFSFEHSLIAVLSMPRYGVNVYIDCAGGNLVENVGHMSLDQTPRLGIHRCYKEREHPIVVSSPFGRLHSAPVLLP